MGMLAALLAWVENNADRNGGLEIRREWKVSSPRTRGSSVGERTSMIYLGVIPAHAGIQCGWRDRWSRRKRHPRARGDPVMKLKNCLNEYKVIPAHAGIQSDQPTNRSTDQPINRSTVIPAHAEIQ